MRRSLLLVSCAAMLVLGLPSAAAAPALDTRMGIAEGFRNAGAMSDLQAGWERIIFAWDEIQPDGPGDFSHLGITISDDQLQRELNRGEHIVGLIEFTPGWAAANPDQGRRSPPRNLDLPFNDPSNYWGRVVNETVKHYAGRINEWVVWNEPEFKPGDPGAGGSFTWLGTDEQFAQLQKVAYLSAKQANPNATVSFPGTSYWIDAETGRPQFYDRLLSVLANDPDAAANNDFHDATALNLYRAPDDVYRVYNLFKGIQHAHGIDKPLWLTETNAMPSDDAAVACPHADATIRTTLEQQGAYVIQAFALAAAAGYNRFEVYQMTDQNACQEPAVWGMTRDDGSWRPAAHALQAAIPQLAGYTSAQFVPLVRDTAAWSAWPDDPSSLLTNWQVYQVAFDKPGNQRVSVLWNGDGSPLRVRVRKNGSQAHLVDRSGASQPAVENQGWWVIDLPAATAHYPDDPDGYHFIGGDPLMLVEDGVAPGTPVSEPALGDPGSAARDFTLDLNPANGQTVSVGQPADFFVATHAHEGFADPLTLSLVQWSSQREPDPKDPSSLPLNVTLPGSVAPGQTATVHVETAGAAPGIYFLTLQASGGGLSHTLDLALALN